MKSLRVDTGCYLYKVYNYHDSEACGYKQSGILPRLEGMVLVWLWYGLNMVSDQDDFFGIAVWSCVIYRTPFVDHTLC
jgi:hypothetical protein